MAISTRPPRTISDIKTHSGRGSGDHQIYRDYFQVGALELERWRRTREREAASSRIAGIDSRIADIDKEKEMLLAGAAAACVTVDGISKPTEKKKSSGLRIKY
ncbi:MAG: hypothetical protein Q8L15_20140 [Methylobacter sp.]|nr:hypothetical protein [Methylobacter sp.]